MKNITQPLKVIVLALALSIGISYVSAWTSPSSTPPNGNVAAPINVSSTAQIKTGDFSAWNLISNGVVTNNAVVTNSIAGNTVATNNLVVATGAAAGKVLTSDATGNATWQTVAGTPGPQGPAGIAGAAGPQGPAGAGIVVSGGIAQIWKVLAGQVISCKAPGFFGPTYYAMVDMSGTYYIREGAGAWMHTPSMTDSGYGRSISVSLAGLFVTYGGDSTAGYWSPGGTVCATPWS